MEHGAVWPCDFAAAPPNAADSKNSISVRHKTSYDESTTMVRLNHASAGTQVFGYCLSNPRAQTTRYGGVRNGNTVTDDPEGLGGERLMEFQETCTGGACGSYTETQRWTYFAGRKMFSKTGTTLKAITPNRLASEAKHFPYGETDGPPPNDTKDYFATYRRDTTGLDYAWNRYYSPTMGRFTTADPYGGSVRLVIPESWNRYTYVGNNPIAYVDPLGLFQLRPPSEGPAIPTHICNYDPWFCNEDYKPDAPIDTTLIAQTRRDEQDSQRRAFDKYMEERMKWLQRALDKFGKEAKFEPSSDECKNALNAIGVSPHQINGTAQITKWMPIYTLSPPALNGLRAKAGDLSSIAFWQDAGDPRRFDPDPSKRVVQIYYNQLGFNMETESEMMGAVLEEVIHSVSREFSDSYLAEKLNITLPKSGATDQIGKTLGKLCFPTPAN